MRFYLASWVGDGTPGSNPYRPSVGEGMWAGLDLRPDSTVQAGRVLVATPEPITTVPREVLDLGELAESIPRGVSRKLEAALGLTLDQFDSIQAILAELLILHGDNLSRGSRTRWGPLKQNRRGRHHITMLGETLYDAPVVEGVVVTDDFNRADSDSLGADWTEVAGNWQIVTNELREDANQGGDNRVRNENDLASDDHYAQVEVDSIAGNKRRGVACRFASAAQTFYSFNSRPTPASTARELQKWVNGVETTLASNSTADAVPFTIRLEVDGSSLDGKIGGVSVVTDTDTDITGNTRCGIVTQNGATGAANEDEASFFDNFEAGDLAAGGVSIELVPVSIAAQAQALDLSLTALTTDLTPASLLVSPQALSPSLTPLAVELTPASLSAIAQALGLSLTALTTQLSPATLQAIAQAVTPDIASGFDPANLQVVVDVSDATYTWDPSF